MKYTGSRIQDSTGSRMASSSSANQQATDMAHVSFMQAGGRRDLYIYQNIIRFFFFFPQICVENLSLSALLYKYSLECNNLKIS